MGLDQQAPAKGGLPACDKICARESLALSWASSCRLPAALSLTLFTRRPDDKRAMVVVSKSCEFETERCAFIDAMLVLIVEGMKLRLIEAEQTLTPGALQILEALETLGNQPFCLCRGIQKQT